MQADHDKVLRKLRIVRGQVDGLIQMVEDDRYCIDISNQVMAAIGILKNVNKEVLEGHLAHCVKDAVNGTAAERAEKIDEIIGVINKLTK